MKEMSLRSIMKADDAREIVSLVETRVMILSVKPIMALVAGTKHPIWAWGVEVRFDICAFLSSFLFLQTHHVHDKCDHLEENALARAVGASQNCH